MAGPLEESDGLWAEGIVWIIWMCGNLTEPLGGSTQFKIRFYGPLPMGELRGQTVTQIQSHEQDKYPLYSINLQFHIRFAWRYA